ncbi:hypothetical protein Droror1_Dr00026938 [Drosera rotundifolia]
MQGNLLQTVGGNWPSAKCPEVGETLAIWLGLELARDSGYRKIVIESDTKMVTGMLQGGKGNLLTVGSIVDYLVLVCLFEEFIFSCVKRDAHRATHEMASYVSECHKLGD